jgi:hypothetical protein
MSITEIIPPEIKNDQFYSSILQVAAQLPGKHFLEIGSSSGAGSTEAWVRGISENPHKPHLHCIEVSRPRFDLLQQTYAHNPQVHCHWGSSVDLSRFPSREEVADFYHSTNSTLKQYPLEQVLEWLDQDIEYIRSANAPTNTIKKILQENNLCAFDAVLIDGSEFLGAAEFAEVYGASIILLDDIECFKCYHPCRWLKNDPNYQCLIENSQLRNGFAVFQRRS